MDVERLNQILLQFPADDMEFLDEIEAAMSQDSQDDVNSVGQEMEKRLDRAQRQHPCWSIPEGLRLDVFFDRMSTHREPSSPIVDGLCLGQMFKEPAVERMVRTADFFEQFEEPDPPVQKAGQASGATSGVAGRSDSVTAVVGSTSGPILIPAGMKGPSDGDGAPGRLHRLITPSSPLIAIIMVDRTARLLPRRQSRAPLVDRYVQFWDERIALREKEVAQDRAAWELTLMKKNRLSV